MAKKINVIVAQGVKHQGKYPAIGTQVDMDEKEAKRLLELGAVTLPSATIVSGEGTGKAPAAPPAGKGAATQPPAKGKGAAANASPPAPSEEELALIAKIEAAETMEALEALMPTDEPSAVVVAAFEKRAEELK